jgi:hypothetical protein
MIKCTAQSQDGKKVYFLGLSRENVDRLTAGQPIVVDLSEMEGPKIDVAIIFGETEEILFDALKTSGLIPTEIKFQQPEIGTIQKVFIRHGKPVGDESNG